ncbi:MAG: hypothetical protein AAF492_26255 [Verrucomicrobiota bacterium]
MKPYPDVIQTAKPLSGLFKPVTSRDHPEQGQAKFFLLTPGGMKGHEAPMDKIFYKSHELVSLTAPIVQLQRLLLQVYEGTME